MTRRAPVAGALVTVLVALLGGLVGVVTAPSAAAHDVLRSTSPADGSELDALPDQVVLTFDEPALAIGSQVVVTGPSGPIGQGAPTLVDTEVRQAVGPGPAGRYTVTWRVTSADGHPISGSFAFTTRQSSGGAGTTTSTPTTSTPATPGTGTTPATAGTVTTPATALPSTTVPTAGPSSPSGPTVVAVAPTGGSSGTPLLWVVVGLVVLLVAVVTVVVARRRRTSGG